jgi:hypothetical protein
MNGQGERMTAQNQRPGATLHDFCLWPYEALCDTAGKRPYSDLLRASFAQSTRPQQLEALLTELQQELGEQATVWGVKWDGQSLSWELYFYDYARTGREVSIARLQAVLGSRWTEAPRVEHIPYFMFSIEVDGEGRVAPGADVYVGSPGSDVSAGLCYACVGDAITFKNFYHFFDGQRGLEPALEKLSNSMHLPNRLPAVDELLWPMTRRCQTLVIANKRAGDGIYYSRVRADQLAWFASRMGFPASLRQWLDKELDAYSHMLFDLGVDFRQHEGRVDFYRGAFYGVA